LYLSRDGGWREEENNVFIRFGEGGMGRVRFVGCAVEESLWSLGSYVGDVVHLGGLTRRSQTQTRLLLDRYDHGICN
jgi:hypothetical protein